MTKATGSMSAGADVGARAAKLGLQLSMLIARRAQPLLATSAAATPGGLTG
jgi:hypothetical protein